MSEASKPHPNTIWAIVPAGGNGSRYATGRDKLLVMIAGIPVLARTVLALLRVPSIQGIIVVSSEANQETYDSLIRHYAPSAQVQFALGGSSRRESVYNGLLAVPESAQIVVVHDAARPLIQTELIEQAIQRVQTGEHGAVVAIPIQDTVKEVIHPLDTVQSPPVITTTMDRSRLWRAQTPQVFQKDRLLQAHQQVPLDASITDDAQLLELAGQGPVSIVPGNERNLKVTHPIDILMAEAFLKADEMPLL
jgi:2-C-methyl-D-erythritol 4-phosphate cytidylyltransferase